MTQTQIPSPCLAFHADGSIAISGVLLCRTRDFDVWRFVCPFCASQELFHDVRTTWKGLAFNEDVPECCCPSRPLSLFVEAVFDDDGRCLTEWPTRFVSYGDGVLWSAAIAKHVLQPTTLKFRQQRFNFRNGLN